MNKKICLWLSTILLLLGGVETARAQLLINEIYSTPPNSEPEWLEIYNNSDSPVPLQNWKIAEEISGVIKNHELIDKTGEATISARGLWVVETSRITLNNSGDVIYLFDPSEKLVETVTFPKLTSQQSYGRWPDGSAQWQIGEPSRGKANHQLNEEEQQAETSSTQTSQQTTDSKGENKSDSSNNEAKTTTKTSSDQQKIAKQKSWQDEVEFRLPKYLYDSDQPSKPQVASSNNEDPESSSPANLQLATGQPDPYRRPLTIGAIAAIILGLALIILAEWLRWQPAEKQDAQKIVEF